MSVSALVLFAAAWSVFGFFIGVLVSARAEVRDARRTAAQAADPIRCPQCGWKAGEE